MRTRNARLPTATALLLPLLTVSPSLGTEAEAKADFATDQLSAKRS